MPASWESVASKPEFQALAPDQKSAAAKQYFDTVVAPKVPKEQLGIAQQQFVDHVKEEKKPVMYGRGQLPIPNSKQTLLTNQDIVNGAMMVPAGIAEGAALKVGGALENAATRAYPKIAQGIAQGKVLPYVSGAAKGAGAGAVGGATFGAGTGQPIGKSAAIGAGLGLAPEAIAGSIAALGKGAKSVAKDAENLKMGYSARDSEALDKAVAVMDAKSDAAATKMRDMGIRFKPETAQQLAAHIEDSWKEAKLGKPDVALHGESMQVLEDLKTKSQKGFDMQDLDNFRKRFRQIANKGGEDGKFAGEALDAMRTAAESFRSKLPPGSTFLPYVDQYAQARRFDALTDIVKKAGGDPQKIKRGFKALLGNDKKIRGYTAEEKAAIKSATEYTTSEGLMTLAGKFGVKWGKNDFPTLPTIGAGVAKVFGASNPLVAAGIAGGTAAKKGAQLIGRGKAERALQAVEGRKITSDQALGAETDPLAAGAIK